MYKSFKRTIIDIETNGLLETLLDFSKMPLKIKKEARTWCIVLKNLDDPKEYIVLRKEEVTKEALQCAFKDTVEIVAHNGIKFDFIFLKLMGVFDYQVYSYLKNGFNGTLFNKPVKITDTLILSKLLNPDRFFGHSLQAWGEYLGDFKDDYRQVCIDKGYIEEKAPRGAEFQEYHEELIPYCITDTTVTATVYKELVNERGRFKIDDAFHMEMKLADLTLRQQYYGFSFDEELASKSVVDLDQKLRDIEDRVNPILPPRLLTKGEQKDYIPPVRQFKRNGDFSSYLLNFIDKIGAEVSEDKQSIVFEREVFPLPLDSTTCLKKSVVASVKDLDNLKAYLLDLGWIPIEWKERDLTKDSKKKAIPPDKIQATIERYVNNTLNGPYKKARLELLNVKEEDLLEKLTSKIGGYGIRVPVSPSLKIGTDKKLCPNLEHLGSSASFVTDVVEYFTYKHRRNSIAGSTEDEFGEPLTGYLSQVRVDGRVSTPADTNGAGTTRYRHIGVANVPRNTSLYGGVMRALFGPGDGRIQFGFDFSGLEARVNGHFVLPYFLGKELADSLVAEKPNDCFDKETMILTDEGWITSNQISKNTNIAQWCPLSNTNTFATVNYTKPTNIIRRSHSGTMITVTGDRLDIKVTPNHRIVLFNKDIKELVVLEARELKEYVKNNNNCYIPSSGYSTEVEKQDMENLLKIVISKSEKDSGFVYQSLDLGAITEIATNQRLRGSSSLILEKELNGKTIYQTIIGKAPLNTHGFKLIYEEIGEVETEEDVWCVSVPSTFVIVKRNNKIYVSGNCHCLPSTNEVLTRNGWVSFDDLEKGEEIVQWDNGKLSFAVPSEIVRGKQEVLYEFTNNVGFKMTTTGSHRVLTQTLRGNYKTDLAETFKDGLPRDRVILISGQLDSTGLVVQDFFIKLLVAVQADGSFEDKAIRFKFHKQRKVERLKEILNNLRITYSLSEEGRFYIPNGVEIVSEYLDDNKDFKPILLNLNKNQTDIFISEIQYWDGTLTKNNNIIFDSHSITSRDFIHTLCSLNSILSFSHQYIKPNPFKLGEVRTVYRVTISNTFITKKQTKPVRTNSIKVNMKNGLFDVACVTVPSSYFLCREGDTIFVTGNTINANRLGISRDDAKAFGYAIMYGASPAKLAKMLRVSEQKGQELYDLYWEGVPALSQLREKVEKFWESTGKSYILSVDGRKLLVRSKHSLINLLFQSTGSLIMKYTAIEICAALEEQGLLGDPFLHTSDAEKVFMMIVYHDEAQFSCHPSLFKIRKFKTKEEITEKYSKSGSPSHVGDEYWVAEENTLSTIVDESVDKVVRDFKLKVPLGVEWQVGGSWRIMSLIDLLIDPNLNSFSNILNLENELWMDIESHKRFIPSFKSR